MDRGFNDSFQILIHERALLSLQNSEFCFTCRILQEFSEEVETQIQGLNADIDTRGLAGGARINRLFYNEFADNLSLVSINRLIS